MAGRMFLLGHLGIALGLAAALAWRWPAVKIDYRVVLLGAMLPDLIDKPLGAVLGLQSRLWAHTLLFLVALAALSRMRPLRGLTWIAFGVGVHLVLDLIWFEPGIALWPLLGWTFPPGALSLGGYLTMLMTDPYVQVGEISGAVLLVAFAKTHGLLSCPALQRFLRTGALPEPA